MISSYFSFGQDHIHKFYASTGAILLDKDIIVKITDKDPREKMFELFGDVWSQQYDELPDMKYFPRGIFDLTKGKRVAL